MRRSQHRNVRSKGGGGSGNNKKKHIASPPPPKPLNCECATMYELTWRDPARDETIVVRNYESEEYPSISITMVPKGAYVTKVYDSKSIFRVNDIVISNFPLRSDFKYNTSFHLPEIQILRQKRPRTNSRRVWTDLNDSSVRIMNTHNDYHASSEIPHNISDVIERLFSRFCDPSTHRIDPWQCSAMLSSSLYSSYTPTTWPVSRWFRDSENGTLTKVQFERACKKCCVIAPRIFRSLLNAMSLPVVSSHERVGYASRRLILCDTRKTLQDLTISLLISINRRHQGKPRKHSLQQAEMMKKKGFNLSRSQSRLLSSAKKKPPTQLELRRQNLLAEIMSRPNLVRRILVRSVEFPIKMVVFTVGVETFRSVGEFFETVVKPLEKYLQLKLRSIVDTRAHSSSRKMRHRTFSRFCDEADVRYVRYNKSSNIGMVRSYMSPVLVIGNHQDIQESSERAHLSSRLSSNKIARVIHLTSAGNDDDNTKLLFSLEPFHARQCLALGTKRAARAMLNAASDSSGNFFDFGWGTTVFSPLSSRIRRTSHAD